MNKLLPFALALALALPGCAAGDTAPQSPETPTTTTETAAEAPAESTLPGLAGRLRQTSYDTAAVGQTFYGMMSTYDDETLTSVYTIIATDTAANIQQKAAELETQGYYTSLAAWQDGLELYIDDWLDETGQPVTNSYQNGDITSWRYKIATPPPARWSGWKWEVRRIPRNGRTTRLCTPSGAWASGSNVSTGWITPPASRWTCLCRPRRRAYMMPSGSAG